MKKQILLLLLFTLLGTKSRAQENDSVPQLKKFGNLGFIGILSTNGYYEGEMTNNVSLALFHGQTEHLRGFSLAPFNAVGTMHGLQIGVSNGAEEARGIQIGLNNGANKLRGVQLGMINFVNEQPGGVQVGLVNVAKRNGLQIGLANVADHNDFPIGFVNIIKDGEMRVGLSTDEMSSGVALFRSGGKYLYGVAGAGYSFASSNSHVIFEGGIGAHMVSYQNFRLDSELTIANFSKTYVYIGDPDKAEEKAKDHDFKTANRLSFRLLPSVRMGRHIELIGGPSINYLWTRTMDNERMFPSQYIWRDFGTKYLKQVHWGWHMSVSYRI